MRLTDTISGYISGEDEESELGDGVADPEAGVDPHNIGEANEAVEPGFLSSRTSSGPSRRSPDDNNLEAYWEIYKNFPLVRRAISIYAADVVEPGYRIDTDDEELEERIHDWLDEVYIEGGEQDHDFVELLQDTVVQREVRGTALGNVVYNTNGGIWGFQMINVSTVAAYTYDGKTVLIRPNEDAPHDDVPGMTSREEAAAYVQFDDEALGGPFDTDEVYLSQNDIVKVARDIDTSDVFGTSTIQAVKPEVDGLRKILRDNEEAIATKGYPHWIFKLGEPAGTPGQERSGVWPDAKIRQFAKEHKSKNYTAGQKDFVPGDAEVDVISSDIAEIEQLIDRYVNMIMSGLPVPKFKLGFADNVNRDITSDQRAEYRKEIQKARRDLERAFTPVIERKVEEWGFEDADVDFRIRPEEGESPLKDDEFDAGEFNQMMDGIIKVQDQAGGQIMTSDEIRTQILGLPALDDEEAGNESEADPDEEAEERSCPDCGDAFKSPHGVKVHLASSECVDEEYAFLEPEETEQETTTEQHNDNE